MTRTLISKTRLILICIFLSIFIIGTVLIFILPSSIKVTYGLTTETVDGATISFNVFEPVNGDNNMKAVLIGHGANTNKEMMKGYAVELAAAGFVAVAFDFRGNGQSTGDRSTGDLVDDIRAVKEYLNSRADVDIHNLGYIGLSMGGVGQALVNESLDFKCFIGTATWVSEYLRIGNESAPLNVLMIQAKFDEIVELSGIKESLSIRTGVPVEDFNVNKLYGSFETGNASMIYLDDNSNHLLSLWDTDFIRQARNWVINTFPDVVQVDEDFHAHGRLIILILQLFGGLGLFFLTIEPLSELVLGVRKKEILDRKTIILIDTSVKRLSIKIIGFSILTGLLGIIIMLIATLFLGLATLSLVISIIFGQAFALFLLLWRSRKHSKLSLREMLAKPFKKTESPFWKQVLLGFILGGFLYVILYLSIGLNYFAMVPSIIKVIWVPIYYIIVVFIFLLYGYIFQLMLQPKFKEGLKGLVKVALLIFCFIFIYMFFYILLFSLLIGTFYYFGFMVPLSVPIFLLISFVWAISYQKTGNIIVGPLVSAFFFVMMISTAVPAQNLLSFITGMLF